MILQPYAILLHCTTPGLPYRSTLPNLVETRKHGNLASVTLHKGVISVTLAFQDCYR
uniref:Uncharacterized protein n=1 Tax=Candidatus Kentrum sp. LPFa TaxID=2126335 RepID=A0A450W3C3_9GAMM|nr:MAG: hypothetical protein BECKLPF1236A_GA0070988_100547 [Candidatus Kentron sp. LPFa]VFK27591.1 MAG: hypothetical protein BECKLPF1236C_GA0070990_100497 [Candidatus Kentron sp. LPFa]